MANDGGNEKKSYSVKKGKVNIFFRKKNYVNVALIQVYRKERGIKPCSGGELCTDSGLFLAHIMWFYRKPRKVIALLYN